MNTEKKWQWIVDGRISVFRSTIAAEGSRNEMADYLVGVDALFTTKDELSSYHLKVSDLKAISEACIARTKENPDFPKQYVENSLKAIRVYLDTTRQCGNLSEGETLSVEQIRDRFEKYYDLYKKYYTYVILRVGTIPILTESITRFLVEKVGEEQSKDYFSKLTKPAKMSEANREQMDLVKLAVDVLRDDIADYSELLQQHYEKYRWLNIINFDEHPFAYNYYETRLTELMDWGLPSLTLKAQDTQDQLASDEETYERIVKELGIEGNILDQIETMRQYTWLQTYRVEMQWKANFNILNLFKEIARHFNITRRNLAALMPKEVLGLISGEPIPGVEVLEARLKDYVILSEGGTVQLFYGEEGQQILKRELG